MRANDLYCENNLVLCQPYLLQGGSNVQPQKITLTASNCTDSGSSAYRIGNLVVVSLKFKPTSLTSGIVYFSGLPVPIPTSSSANWYLFAAATANDASNVYNHRGCVNSAGQFRGVGAFTTTALEYVANFLYFTNA